MVRKPNKNLMTVSLSPRLLLADGAFALRAIILIYSPLFVHVISSFALTRLIYYLFLSFNNVGGLLINNDNNVGGLGVECGVFISLFRPIHQCSIL